MRGVGKSSSESRADLRDGRAVTIRTTRPDDGAAVQFFIRNLSDESRYRRFLLGLRELPAAMLQRIVQADQRSEVALIAVTLSPVDAAVPTSGLRVVGLAQYVYAGQHGSAEIAVAVHENWRRAGLATRLMSRLVERARELGIEWGEAEILRGNAPALQLARNFGGRIESDYRSAFLVKVRAPICASAMLPNVVPTLPRTAC